MPGCDQISIGALYDCQNPLQGGAKSRLLLMNLDDVSTVTVNSSDVITALTMLTNRVAYVFEGFRNSLVKSEEMITPAAGQPTYRHKIEFTVFDISQLQKNNIQRMAMGRLVAIVENTQKGSNSFEIYGLGAGLVLAPGSVRASNANNGAFRLVLQSAENEEEVKLPQTFLSTDYATTLTAVNGLAAFPTITSLNVTSVAAAGGTAVTITGTNFFGGVGVNQVTSVVWVNQSTGSRVNQATFTVASNTSITLTSVALTAGPYKVEVTTTRGVAQSVAIVTAS